MKRRSKVGHDAGHPRGKSVGHLQHRPPRRRRDVVVPPRRHVDLSALYLSSTLQYPRRVPHAAPGARVLVVVVGVPRPQVRGGATRTFSRNDDQDVIRRPPVHHTG